jgi:hypothetical protein
MSHQRQHTHSRRVDSSAGQVNDVNRQDLLDLAEHLRQERLFVQHEKNQVRPVLR